jgi:concanavalin A-like lectin/glucanase superfamily protein
MKRKFTFFNFISSAAFVCCIVTVSSCSKDATQSKVNASSNENASADNLVALYTFNGDAKDHSGNGNDASFNNATLTAGKNGTPNTAYLFNGTNSYMSVPNSSSLNPSTAITIVAIVQPLGFYQGECHSNRVISKGADDNDKGRYNIGYDDQPYWQYQGCDREVKENKESFYSSYGDGHGSAAGLTDLAIHVQQGKWYTLAFTYDGKRSNFYVNGKLQASSVKSSSFTANSNPVYIGKNQDPNFPYYFNGIIDEIRIYNTALSQNKVQQFNP